jgi:hypothetical protein
LYIFSVPHWIVPKKELVSTMQVMLQTRRVKLPSTLPEAATLTQELEKFRAKITDLSEEDLLAWREGPHDDLVLAVSCEAWMGECHR